MSIFRQMPWLTRHVESLREWMARKTLLLEMAIGSIGSKAPSQWRGTFGRGGTAKASLASGELPYALLDAPAHETGTFFSRFIFAGSRDYLNRIFAIIPLSS